jgi:hypothetical protein
VDRDTGADHADLRPTTTTLLCLKKDDYTHEGRALMEDLMTSALPDSVQDACQSLISLGRTFKQLNAPVGLFGSDAIHVSTTAIKGDAATYTSLENQLNKLVTDRDALATSIEAQLNKVPGCGGLTASPSDHGAHGSTLEELNDRGPALLEARQRLAMVDRDDGTAGD